MNLSGFIQKVNWSRNELKSFLTNKLSLFCEQSKYRKLLLNYFMLFFNIFKYEITHFIIILLYFCLHAYLQSPMCFTLHAEQTISYQGFTSFMRPLDDLMQGKIFHKDFYFFYGPIYLLMMVPIFSFFDGEFVANCVISDLYFPALAVLMSYIYIRLLIKSPFLRICFVLVCIFHVTNSEYPSPRHLAAELAIAFFIFSLSKRGSLYPIITGVLASIAIFTSFEYGLSASFFIFTGYLILFCFQGKDFPLRNLAFYSIGLASVASPFIGYMFYHEIFMDFMTNYPKFLMSMNGGANPARGAFLPPFPEPLLVRNLFFTSWGSIASALTSEAFRFYLPLITYAIALVVSTVWLLNSRTVSAVKIIVLTLYGVISYYRVFSGPAYGGLAWGLVPAITLGFLYWDYVFARCRLFFLAILANQENINGKTMAGFVGYSSVFIICLVWNFSSTQDTRRLSFDQKPIKTPSVPDDSKYVDYNRVGFKISQYTYERFNKINTFIEENIKPSDFLMVYPWGPYNLFTGRPSPFRNHDVAYGYFQIPEFRIRAVERLKKLKLKYIILNTSFGNGGTVSVGTIKSSPNQTSWLNEEGLIFSGNDDPINIYILENYHILEKVDPYAVIVERNEERRPFDRKFLTVATFPEDLKKVSSNGIQVFDHHNRIKIDSRKVRIEFHLKKPIVASHIKLTYRFNADFGKKTFTKSQMTMGIIRSDGTLGSFFSSLNDLGDIGKPKSNLLGISIPMKSYTKEFKAFWVEVETRDPYFLPEYFEISSLEALLDTRINLE